MNLTTQQETEYLNDYKSLIHRVINKFVSKSTYSTLDRDDLFQECAIVFIKALRKAEGPHELRTKFPFRDMTHAMSVYALGKQTLSYPKRTSSMKDYAQTFQEAYDISILAESESKKPDEYRDAETMIDFERFMANLEPEEQKILSLKVDGCRNHEIASQLKLDSAFVSRVMQKIRKKALKYLLV